LLLIPGRPRRLPGLRARPVRRLPGAFAPNLDKISSPFPFSFLGWLIGVNHIAQAEFYIYLAFVYALGITRLRQFPCPMIYAAFQLAFYVCIGSEDWSRYFPRDGAVRARPRLSATSGRRARRAGCSPPTLP
jgi:hypothetical protein